MFVEMAKESNMI